MAVRRDKLKSGASLKCRNVPHGFFYILSIIWEENGNEKGGRRTLRVYLLPRYREPFTV